MKTRWMLEGDDDCQVFEYSLMPSRAVNVVSVLAVMFVVDELIEQEQDQLALMVFNGITVAQGC